MYLTCKEEIRYRLLDYRSVILFTRPPFEKEYQAINWPAEAIQIKHYFSLENLVGRKSGLMPLIIPGNHLKIS